MTKLVAKIIPKSINIYSESSNRGFILSRVNLPQARSGTWEADRFHFLLLGRAPFSCGEGVTVVIIFKNWSKILLRDISKIVKRFPCYDTDLYNVN